MSCLLCGGEAGRGRRAAQTSVDIGAAKLSPPLRHFSIIRSHPPSDLPGWSLPDFHFSGVGDERRRGQRLAGAGQRLAVVRVRVHPGAGRRVPAHLPVPALPVRVRGGPAGERAGAVGELAAAALGRRRPLLRAQRQPVGQHGDRRAALLHDGGDGGARVAVGPLPVQADHAGLRRQLLQQLLLPGRHDPGALPGAEPAVGARPVPGGGAAALGPLRGPLALLPAAGAAGERARGPAGVERAGLLHAARGQLRRVVRLGGLPVPDLPVPGARLRHRGLQRADRPGRALGPRRAGPAAGVAGARLLAGLPGLLAALPPGHDADDHQRPVAQPLQLQRGGVRLLLLQRGAKPVALPLRGQPRPLQLPEQELPRAPRRRRGQPAAPAGPRRATGRRRDGRRRGPATQVQ